MMEPNTLTDGQSQVTTDKLVPGSLYEVKADHDGNPDHLRKLPPRDDDLPKLRIEQETLTALRQFTNDMGRLMGGYKPDLTISASALLAWVVKHPEAMKVVQAYVIEKFTAVEFDGERDVKTEPETGYGESDHSQVTKDA